MAGLYLLALAASLAGLALIDWRWRLAFFYAPRRSAAILAVALLLFIVWDIAGIVSGIYFVGGSPYLTGWQLGPQFPVEEIGFLLLLNYNALLVWTYLGKRNV